MKVNKKFLILELTDELIQRQNVPEVDLMRGKVDINEETPGYIPKKIELDFDDLSPQYTPGSLPNISIHNRESFNFNNDDI
jgi:hypothetical protein